MRWVVALIGLAALGASGCGVGACTAIGCDDQVRVTLSSAQQMLFANPVEVSFCVDGACTSGTIGGSSPANGTFEIGGTGLVVRRSLTGLAKATLRLTLTQQGTQQLDRTWPDVTLSTSMPNGPGCAPTCHSAVVDASS